MSNANNQAQNGLAVGQRKVERDINKMAIVAHNNLSSLANSIPIQQPQRGMMSNDSDSGTMIVH
ncbi:MAG: hypothetical protein EOP47_21710 [Sphingobacteriaceae bacterium]|nr:MAG: hypothetical protein EOP47_21710 [Sphingobacteriaceae bacterium]